MVTENPARLVNHFEDPKQAGHDTDGAHWTGSLAVDAAASLAEITKNHNNPYSNLAADGSRRRARIHLPAQGVGCYPLSPYATRPLARAGLLLGFSLHARRPPGLKLEVRRPKSGREQSNDSC